MDRLPPEIVADIIAHVACLPVVLEGVSDPVESRQRWRSLHRMSLVCREWRTVAQRLMFASSNSPDEPALIRIHHSHRLVPLVQLVVDVPTQGIASFLRALDVTLWGESSDSLAALVHACKHLERLQLEHVDRVQFEQVVTPSLQAFSARQCTFISSEPFSTTPYPPITKFPNLKYLDLRFNSTRRGSLPVNTSALPRLEHLLFFTGSQDQSNKTVQQFLTAVAPRIRSISLDQPAWDLFEQAQRDSIDLDAWSNLETLGLYWDAAALSIAGSHLVLRARTATRVPRFVHLSLYPLAISSLLATLTSLFDSSTNELPYCNEIQVFELEQTFKQLGVVAAEQDLGSDDDAQDREESDGQDSNEEVAEEGMDREDGSTRSTRSLDDKLLRKFVRIVENAGIPTIIDRDPNALGRGTQERGFETSWWRFHFPYLSTPPLTASYYPFQPPPVPASARLPSFASTSSASFGHGHLGPHGSIRTDAAPPNLTPQVQEASSRGTKKKFQWSSSHPYDVARKTRLIHAAIVLNPWGIKGTKAEQWKPVADRIRDRDFHGDCLPLEGIDCERHIMKWIESIKILQRARRRPTKIPVDPQNPKDKAFPELYAKKVKRAQAAKLKARSAPVNTIARESATTVSSRGVKRGATQDENLDATNVVDTTARDDEDDDDAIIIVDDAQSIHNRPTLGAAAADSSSLAIIPANARTESRRKRKRVERPDLARFSATRSQKADIGDLYALQDCPSHCFDPDDDWDQLEAKEILAEYALDLTLPESVPSRWSERFAWLEPRTKPIRQRLFQW
ncbi:uncharacterized protein JCM15063_004640 [Sporobolomyces koalae]|uniref:uncharacterized protein n=1 Tax=Sporobolomyces koalae TaxID=500713 RepID=UPI003178C51E